MAYVLDNQQKEEERLEGKNIDDVEYKLSNSGRGGVVFKISYQGRHFDCHRRINTTARGALRKFCKQMGKDLLFKFNEKRLTGVEKIEDLEGGIIIASVIENMGA